MDKAILVIFLIIFIICIISIIICYIRIDISYFNIRSKKIDKDIKILFLTDIHNRNLYKKIKEIIDIEKPDIIICGGDMMNGLSKSSNFINISSLFSGYKTYYTFGNHEEGVSKDNNDEYREYIKQINKTNIILLNNKSEYITNNIKIYGLNINIDDYGRFGNLCLNRDKIYDYIGNLNKNNFNILIAHNPLEFNSYCDIEADLVLCGHIHGGAIILPFIGGLLSPDFTFFPKYYNGLYKKNNTKMIVSRGLGFSSKLPFRINNIPEITVINLKRK